MRDIGVDVRRELKLIPAKVVVVEHAAHTSACDKCEKTNDHTPIAKAQNPEPLISGSLASPSLVAHIAYQKYMNGLPLYRIERGFQYDGIEVSRQTMSNWIIYCTESYLARIYSILKGRLLSEEAIHADETPVQVLHEAGRDAKTKSYEWVYRTGAGSSVHIVIYDYRQTRGHEHPKKFLENFKGFIHADGYEAYHELPDTITAVGCWAHVRRYFNDALKIIPKDKRESSEAWAGMSFINKLFSLEHDFENLTPQERYEERLKQGKPVADAFFEWVLRLGALPKSLLGKAAAYALNQRVFLENVFLDGRLEFSNNRCERSVKPFVMGRKCWLFSNTPRGAVSSSIMYSIIETARENGLNPFQYVKYLLETVPTAFDDELNTLLPWSATLPECCKAPVEQGR
jgi:transposase